MSRMLEKGAVVGYAQQILVIARNEYMHWDVLRLEQGVHIPRLEPRVEDFVRVVLDLIGFPRSQEKAYAEWVALLTKAVRDRATESDLWNELARCFNMSVHVKCWPNAALDLASY